MRATTLGVCLGVWDCSVWDLGCDSVSGYEGSASVSRSLWDSSGLRVWGHETSDRVGTTSLQSVIVTC